MNLLSRHYRFTLLILLILAWMVCADSHAAEPSADELQEQSTQMYQQGRYTDAIVLAQQALAINEKAFGGGDPHTASSLQHLAIMYQDTFAYAKAEPLYQQALAIRQKALGTEHPDTADTLAHLASLYTATGAYTKAEPLYQQALAIDEKALGTEHPDTAATLAELASLYTATGAYAKAEPLLQRALAIDQKALDPDSTGIALPLINLANLYMATGAYAKAVPLCQRAFAIYQNALGPYDPRTVKALRALAQINKETGAHDMAELAYQHIVDMDEERLGPQHPRTAAAIHDLAQLYLEAGAYAKAEPLLQRALAIDEKALGPENALTAAAINALAQLYLQAGAYAKAEPLLQRALTIGEKELGPEHPDTASLLLNLAALYTQAGAYTKAEPPLQRALAIRNKALGPEHPLTASSLNDLATLYAQTGAYAKAEPLFQRALTIGEKAGPDNPDIAVALNNLATLYISTNAYAKAEPLLQRSLAIRNKALGPEHPDTATTLNALAGLYEDTGAYAKAEPLYQRALEIREKVLGPEHPRTALSLYDLAALYLVTGAYQKAEPLLQRALAIQEKALGPEHPSIATTLDSLAMLYFLSRANAKAEPLLQRAQDIQESNTRLFLLAGSESRQQAYLQLRKLSAHTEVSVALAYPTAPSIALGLTSVLQYKGRVLDSIADSAAQLRRSADPADQRLLEQLSAVAQQRSTLTYSPPHGLSYNDIRQQAQTLSQQQEQLEAELSSHSAVFRQSKTPITVESARLALPMRAVLVEWLRYQPYDLKSDRYGDAARYVAFLLKRTGDPLALDLGPAQAIEDLIAEYTRSLSDPSNTTYADVAKDLSDQLVKPLLPHLAQEERLLLSPDAALNLVPFAALVDEHGEYLAKRFEITYLTSGRDLTHMADEPPARSSAVVLADPSYGPLGSALASPKQATAKSRGASITTVDQPTRSVDLDRSGLQFKRLPGTTVEAQTLASLLKLDAQHVLTGDQATEARLRQLHGPRILHLATHAFFLNDQELAAVKPRSFDLEEPVASGENPLLRAGLALAGANQRRSGATDDGILTAAEVAQLDLLGTQLVVLSACETGVGAVQEGDGVYGLRRALVLAGAQAQLVSLWKVADSATQELMQSYYRGLLQGEGRSEALRKVQLAMMANPARQHPYFWASFIPIGDWRPLAQDHSQRAAKTQNPKPSR